MKGARNEVEKEGKEVGGREKEVKKEVQKERDNIEEETPCSTIEGSISSKEDKSMLNKESDIREKRET